MGIVSNFMKNIDEGERWCGRTQSGGCWSPEQLRRGPPAQLETVKIEDQTEGTLPLARRSRLTLNRTSG